MTEKKGEKNFADNTNRKQTGRIITDYRNDDGRFPDGFEDDTDDTHALKTALSEGPGVVFVPAGFFRLGEVAVPSGVTLIGAGSGTILRPVKDAKRIFLQKEVNGWRLRDMVLDGKASIESWSTRRDLGESGIEINKCNGFEISGLVVNNFNGAGIQFSQKAPSLYGSHAPAANIFNIAAGGNHTGIRFDTRAEYFNASMLSCHGNVIGCAIHAGNVKITNSNFTNNLTGMLIEDHINGSHGIISNCLLNHNQQYALLARDVANGMALDNCAFFGGEILLDNCRGVNLSSGIIAGNVITRGEGANRIANNYMIVPNKTLEFCSATVIEGNFTDNGPWEKNSPG